MYNSIKKQVNTGTLKPLSADAQRKIRGGKELPKWLEKLANRTEK